MEMMDLVFPILCFTPYYTISVYEDEDAFTVGWRSAIKKGCYQNDFVVDYNGMGAIVESVSILHGVGMFGGYTLFDRRVKLQFAFQQEAPVLVAVADIRKKIETSFRKLPTWQALDPDYWKQFRATLKSSESTVEIVHEMITWLRQ